MFRHGELLIKPVNEIKGKKLNHLILAEGEATGHKHEVMGDAELYEHEKTLYLHISDTSILTHPDHKTLELPIGDYEITTQREYVIGDEKYRNVAD